MSIQKNQELALLDGEGKRLGHVRVREVRQDLVLGDFCALSDFDHVAPVFAEFIEAANEQVLSVIAELDRKISSLRLQLEAVDGTTVADIFDVQIGDGRINFRVRGPISATSPNPTTPSLVDQSIRQSIP